MFLFKRFKNHFVLPVFWNFVVLHFSRRRLFSSTMLGSFIVEKYILQLGKIFSDYLFSDFPPSISFVLYLCISDYCKFGLPRLMLLFSYLFTIIFHFLYVPYLLADILIIKMSNAVFNFYHCFKIPLCLLFLKIMLFFYGWNLFFFFEL